MNKRQAAEALVDTMNANGRYGDSIKHEGHRMTFIGMVMKLPVAEIKRRLILEENGTDCRR